jgi:hypothetical protein
MRHVAFADRSDVIRFDARMKSSPRPRGRLTTTRLSSSPGAPEAKSDDDVLAAVVAFVKAAETRLEERAS